MKYKKALITATSIIVLISTIAVIITSLSHSGKRSSHCSSGGCFGCTGCSGNAISKTSVNSSYYIGRKDQLLKTLSEKEKMFRSVLSATASKSTIDQIVNETTSEFVKLVPQIPYIGGDKNPMTEDIEQAAMVLAFYKVESRYGKSVDDVGTTVVTAISQELLKYPKWVMRLNSAKYFTNSYIQEIRDQAAQSQKKSYSGNWISTYTQGNGKDFDYGYNYQQCAILCYYKEQGVPELTPYLCKLDFLYSDSMDEGLHRTTTLAQGGQYCDFKYKRVQNSVMDIITGLIISLSAITIIFLIVILIRFIYSKCKLKIFNK